MEPNISVLHLTDTQKEALASMLSFVSERWSEFVQHCEETVWPVGSETELEITHTELEGLLVNS